MNPVYIKKRGQVGTVYLDNGQPLPIASMEDEPMGFPFTARVEELKSRFAGRQFIIVEDKSEPTVSGVTISDERVAQSIPEARKELGMHVPIRKVEAAPLPPPAATNDVEKTVLDKFRENVRRWHYAKGKEKKELGRDLEAIASFLVDIAPSLEPVLLQIRNEETQEKKRMTF